MQSGEKKPNVKIRLLMVGLVMLAVVGTNLYFYSVLRMPDVSLVDITEMKVGDIQEGFRLVSKEGELALVHETLVGKIGWEVSGGEVADVTEGMSILINRIIYVCIFSFLMWLYWLFLYYVSLKVVRLFTDKAVQVDLVMSGIVLGWQLLVFTLIAKNNQLTELINSESVLYDRLGVAELVLLGITLIAYGYKMKYLRGEDDGNKERDRNI